MGMIDCDIRWRSLRPQAEPWWWAAGSKGCGGGKEFVAHSETVENVCKLEIKHGLLYLFHFENFSDFIDTKTIPIVEQGWSLVKIITYLDYNSENVHILSRSFIWDEIVTDADGEPRSWRSQWFLRLHVVVLVIGPNSPMSSPISSPYHPKTALLLLRRWLQKVKRWNVEQFPVYIVDVSLYMLWC